MVSRTRSLTRQVIAGPAWFGNDRPGTETNSVYPEYSITTKDVWKKLKRPAGDLPPSFFESDSTLRRPPRISRIAVPPNKYWGFDNYAIYGSFTPDDYDYPKPGSAARIAENAILANEVVALTHPFAPVYSVPVAIKEMAELGTLFKLTANTFAGLVGQGYLNYRFGWLQFVKDIKTLHGITKDIEQRLLDYNYMLKHGRTRKKVFLRDFGGFFNDQNKVIQSAYGVTIRADLRNDVTRKTWGSVTWGVMDGSIVPVDELKRFNLAVQQVFDLGRIDAETVWNLIPFSWLADYFITIGTALQTQHMRYQIQAYDVCIMRHYKRKVTTKLRSKPANILYWEGDYLRQIKTRDVVYPTMTPQLSVDLLRGDRWKVVLALLAKFRDSRFPKP